MCSTTTTYLTPVDFDVVVADDVLLIDEWLVVPPLVLVAHVLVNLAHQQVVRRELTPAVDLVRLVCPICYQLARLAPIPF